MVDICTSSLGVLIAEKLKWCSIEYVCQVWRTLRRPQYCSMLIFVMYTLYNNYIYNHVWFIRLSIIRLHRDPHVLSSRITCIIRCLANPLVLFIRPSANLGHQSVRINETWLFYIYIYIYIYIYNIYIILYYIIYLTYYIYIYIYITFYNIYIIKWYMYNIYLYNKWYIIYIYNYIYNKLYIYIYNLLYI